MCTRWLRGVGACPGFRELFAVLAVEPYPRLILAVRLLVGQRPGDAAGVPFLAAGRAGVAADAGVQVDHQPELDLRRRRQRGHGSVRWRSLPEPSPTSSSENTKPSAARQPGEGGGTIPPIRICGTAAGSMQAPVNIPRPTMPPRMQAQRLT